MRSLTDDAGLSEAARQTLRIAQHSTDFGTGVGVDAKCFIRDMLGVAGFAHADDLDVMACQWPFDVSLEIVRTLFRQGGSLAHLRFRHILNEWAPLRT